MEVDKKIFTALEKWKKRENEVEILLKRLRIIDEERIAVKDKLHELRKDKYKYSDIAIKNHKFWKFKDEEGCILIGDIDAPGGGTEFFISDKDEKDKRRFSSSLGILYHGIEPITEEEYSKIYNNL